ncbi:hypothetical protein MBRA_06365 [Methylobacterium brachiatum]|jgi:hypothetical protein|nr:hypothetical protein MBRA_06365 [Methylobacterium brachiatum]
MTKRPRPLPDRSEVTDDTPLHFETAARFAFPDGVVSALALRGAAYRGDLEFERLGGRIITTLRWIGEWRERNRHPAKSADPVRRPAHLDDQYTAAALANARRVLAEMRAGHKGKRGSSATQPATAKIEARPPTQSKTNQIKDIETITKSKTKPRRPTS